LEPHTVFLLAAAAHTASQPTHFQRMVLGDLVVW
jgi:hypothetical protein